MQRYLFVILVLLTCSAVSQDYKLTVTVDSIPQKDVYLATFYGEKNDVIDTTIPDQRGRFTFTMKPDYYDGMYRIFLDKKRFFDIIYNQENIEIKTNYNDIYDSLEIIFSQENKIYYDFLREGNNYHRKFDLLAPLNDYYPRSDSFFLQARAKYILIQADFLAYIDSIVNQFPETFTAKILRQKKPLFYDPSLDEAGRREYAKEHYFDHVDFTDVDLINTNVYTSMAIEYMTLYSNPNFTQEQLENALITAVDKIMYKAMDNEIIYDFIVQYLVGGFERYHFDKVLDYIAENYTPEQCENQERKSDLQSRLEKYAELTVGKPAPEINEPDVEGDTVNLYGINSEYTLVLFWASWCPHCNEMLPKIKNLVDSSINSKKMQIIAVSIDKTREDWVEALNKGSYPWINVSDLKGWDNKAALDYNVYATPTMFLLDRDKKIVAKPITFAELKNDLISENIIR